MHGSLVVGLLILSASCYECAPGMLYPRDSESRESKFLDGLWQFRVDRSPSREQGFDEKWWEKPLSQTGSVIDMPVPASYNDVTEDKSLRDFVGWAWYERYFYVSSDWSNRRVVLRFDSAHYYTVVWLNSKKVMTHNGGHLPFEEEISTFLSVGSPNRLTVAVDNRLNGTTLPPGIVVNETDRSRYPPGYIVQQLQMDFFNYAGIHRHVRLYTTPLIYINDITILSDVINQQGFVNYSVTAVGGGNNISGTVSVFDATGQEVARSDKLSDILAISNPHLWWPFGMSDTVGYRYLLQVQVSDDVYRLPFGIRTVRVTSNQFLINNKPFYCHGVGKHEDADLRGKGLDYTLITKDFNMLRWLGVNCFRTSHYPYAEEILDLADRQGVAIIDESPGVGIKLAANMGNISLKHHLEVMSELVRRDKNKPSVIMWSVANEPASNLEVAVHYFKTVLQYTKDIDPAHRPVTFTCNHPVDTDKVCPYVDVICLNRYYGWYSDNGHTEVIQLQMATELGKFRSRYTKPIMITEYGASTIAGLHMEPSFVFTEEYQVDLLTEFHKGFDQARKTNLVGELVWNFADFMTTQGVTRVVGNKKGLLTRQRQPKRAAFVIRERYNMLARGENTSCLHNPSEKYTSVPHYYGLNIRN